MNCLRSLEFIKKLDRKYKKYGINTILIHAPEWGFEKNKKNILKAMKELRIKIPVKIDRKILKKYSINFWPAQLVIKNNKLVYKNIGEGNYKILESLIQELLKVETKKIFIKEPKYSKYPTQYVGNKKSPRKKIDGWTQRDEYLKQTGKSASLSIKTRGKIISFVARSTSISRVKIKVQGKEKSIIVRDPKLYKLVRFSDARPKNLTITSESNLDIYSFSFQ